MLSSPMQWQASGRTIRLILLVTALCGLVHGPLAAADAGKEANPPPPAKPAVAFQQQMEPAKLPRPVNEMVDAILVAVHSGRIEDLKTALEWNEMPPLLSAEKVEDAISHLKAASADKEGRQLLAILGNLLSVGPARQRLGRDAENNEVLVWPYLAELDLDQLTPSQQVDLYRLVPAETIAAMRAARRWTWYRIVIGADGTWHSFMRHE